MVGRASKLWIASLLSAAALLISTPTECHGQSFAFGISSGGGRCHHGGGWSFGYGVGPYWGPGWGPGWYGPPAVVYAPPPIVQPIYVQPTTVAPVPAPTASPYAATTTPPANATLAADRAPSLRPVADDRIVIRNIAGAQLPVSFLVDGQDIELSDGATRTFIGKAHRTIQYDRGGRFGSTQQDLTGGQYEFRITSTGWDLVRKPDIQSSRTAVRANSLPDSNVAR